MTRTSYQNFPGTDLHVAEEPRGAEHANVIEKLRFHLSIDNTFHAQPQYSY